MFYLHYRRILTNDNNEPISSVTEKFSSIQAESVDGAIEPGKGLHRRYAIKLIERWNRTSRVSKIDLRYELVDSKQEIN